MAEPDVHVASIEALAVIFSQRCLLEARRALASRSRFSIVVPGGSVATAFLPALLAQPIEWARSDVFWGDERAVALASSDSNAGAQRSMWEAKAPEATLHLMDGAAPDLADAASRYAATVAQLAGQPPHFDVVVLGVGEDGHVASLFPGHPEVDERERLVVAVDDSPKPPPRRLTLTLPTLAGARWLCVAAFGASKRSVMHEALTRHESQLPVARLLQLAARATVLLDPDAASSSPQSR